MNRREALKRTAALGGAAVGTTSLMTLLQSCQSQPRLGWQSQFLSADHARLVTALVDTLLPATDTPGGLDVKVDMFIDLAYARMLDAPAQEAQTAQLDAFNTTCTDKFGKPFHELDAAQRAEILREEEARAPKFNGGVWGTAVGEQEPVGFYRSFKSMAIWAYCSSEEIGKNVLNYDPIPGPYQGCIPFEEVGKVWSL